MKKSGITILGILSILMIVVAVSGCTSSNTTNKTYTGMGISFQYPATWTVENITISTPDKGVGGIEKIDSLKAFAAGPPTIPATLDSVSTEMENSIEGTKEKKEITIAGVPGIEYISNGTFEDVGGQRFDVYFANGDVLYNLFLRSVSPAHSDENGFDMMVNTMKFQ
jgi:PsbP-like protein